MSISGVVDVGDAVQIAYTVYGSKTSPVVLLCPGLGATQLGYQADAEFLAGQGRCVVCFDLRGLGKSTRPQLFCKEQFAPTVLAQDVLQLLGKLGIEKADFIGNSLGGLIGLEVIAKQPQIIRSLITFGTTYELNFPWITVPIQAFVYKLMGKRLAGFIAKKGSDKPYAQDIIRRQYADFPTDVGRMMSANIYRYSYLDVVEKWCGPILILKGDLDHAINNNLHTTLAALKKRGNFQLVNIENAGHFTNLDAPQQVRGAIDTFLNALDKQ